MSFRIKKKVVHNSNSTNKNSNINNKKTLNQYEQRKANEYNKIKNIMNTDIEKLIEDLEKARDGFRDQFYKYEQLLEEKYAIQSNSNVSQESEILKILQIMKYLPDSYNKIMMKETDKLYDIFDSNLKKFYKKFNETYVITEKEMIQAKFNLREEIEKRMKFNYDQKLLIIKPYLIYLLMENAFYYNKTRLYKLGLRGKVIYAAIEDIFRNKINRFIFSQDLGVECGNDFSGDPTINECIDLLNAYKMLSPSEKNNILYKIRFYPSPDQNMQEKIPSIQ